MSLQVPFLSIANVTVLVFLFLEIDLDIHKINVLRRPGKVLDFLGMWEPCMHIADIMILHVVPSKQLVVVTLYYMGMFKCVYLQKESSMSIYVVTMVTCRGFMVVMVV